MIKVEGLKQLRCGNVKEIMHDTRMSLNPSCHQVFQQMQKERKKKLCVLSDV